MRVADTNRERRSASHAAARGPGVPAKVMVAAGVFVCCVVVATTAMLLTNGAGSLRGGPQPPRSRSGGAGADAGRGASGSARYAGLGAQFTRSRHNAEQRDTQPKQPKQPMQPKPPKSARQRHDGGTGLDEEAAELAPGGSPPSLGLNSSASGQPLGALLPVKREANASSAAVAGSRGSAKGAGGSTTPAPAATVAHRSGDDDLAFPQSFAAPGGAGLRCGWGAVADAGSMECMAVLQPTSTTQIFTGHNTEGHDGDGFGYVSSLDMANTVGAAGSSATDVVLADAAGPGIFSWLWVASNGINEHTKFVVEVDGVVVINLPFHEINDPDNRLEKLPFLLHCMSDGWGAHHGLSCAIAIPFETRGRILLMTRVGDIIYHEVVAQRYTVDAGDSAALARAHDSAYGVWMAGSPWRSTTPLRTKPELVETVVDAGWLQEHAAQVSGARTAMERMLARVRDSIPPTDFPVIAAASTAESGTRTWSGVCASAPVGRDTFGDAFREFRSGAQDVKVSPLGERRVLTLSPPQASSPACAGVVRMLALRFVDVDISDWDVVNSIRIKVTWDGGDSEERAQVNISLAHMASLSPDDATYRVHNAFVTVDSLSRGLETRDENAPADGLMVRLMLPMPFTRSFRVDVGSIALPAPQTYTGTFGAAPEFSAAAFATIAPAYPVGTHVGRLFMRDTPFRRGIEPLGAPHVLTRVPAAEGAGHLVATATVYHQEERPMMRRLVFGSKQTAHEGDAIARVDGLVSPSLRGSGHEDWYTFGHGYYRCSELYRGAGHYHYTAAEPTKAPLGVNGAESNLMKWDAHRLLPTHATLRWRAGFELTFDLGDGLGCLNRTPVHLESSVTYYSGGFTSPGVGEVPSDVHSRPVAEKQRRRGDAEWVEVDSVSFDEADGSAAAHDHAVSAATSQSVTVSGAHYRNFGENVTRHGFVVGESVNMTVAVQPQCAAIVLQRDFDSSYPNQGALVFVDGAFAGVWFDPGANPFFRIDQSQLALPPALTAGKARLALSMVSIGTTASPGSAGDAACRPNTIDAARGSCRPPNAPVEWASEFLGADVIHAALHTPWSANLTFDAAGPWNAEVDVANAAFDGRSVPAYRAHWTELGYRVLCRLPQASYA